ncbi:MAG: AmmeMemoRadiSam system protein A [Anaerolineae bacterium]|nr:AmmeMemoRadiSam system protein A [Anaerolineae bacterium]
MTESYTPEEQTILLTLARQTLEAITTGQAVPDVNLADLPSALREERACFVTMRRHLDGSLRGCTGTLVARRPLAEEVVQITQQTAFHDPRFLPVVAAEVPDLHLEISVLTPPQPLDYDGPDDLLAKLRPGVDGVTLRLEARRATFLPQVWESYPDPRVFLGLLAEKMGCRMDAWRDSRLEVDTYQAIIIEEDE